MLNIIKFRERGNANTSGSRISTKVGTNANVLGMRISRGECVAKRVKYYCSSNQHR